MNKEYEATLPKEDPKTIFDLGANIGCTAIYFKTKFPQARLVCVEPDPDNFKRLQKNTAQFSNIICLPYALGAKREPRSFHVSGLSHMRHSFATRSGEEQVINVEAVSLDDVFAESKSDSVDFLKFDIEGAEDEVFSTFTAWNKIKNFAGEIHPALIADKGETLIKTLREHFTFTVTSDNGIHYTCSGVIR